MKITINILLISLFGFSGAFAQLEPDAYFAVNAGNVVTWGITHVDGGYYPEVIVSDQQFGPNRVVHKFYENLTENLQNST